MIKLNHLSPNVFRVERHIAEEPMAMMCKRAYYGLQIDKTEEQLSECTCGANDQIRCFAPVRERLKPHVRWGLYTAHGDDWFNFLVSEIPQRLYWGLQNMYRFHVEVEENDLWTPEWNEETQELLLASNVVQVANEMGLAGVNITEEFVAATNHISYYDIPQVIISQKEWIDRGAHKRVFRSEWEKVSVEDIKQALIDFGYSEKTIEDSKKALLERMSDESPQNIRR